MRDTLFLLQPGFVDPRLSQDRYYCTECAALEGLLSFTAPLRERLEVRRIGFERPRAPLVELLGPDHQNCPMLVLGEAAPKEIQRVNTSAATGRRFITGLVPIGEYLATQYGVPRPHP